MVGVIQTIEQRKSGVVSGSCFRKSVLRSLGTKMEVNKHAFRFPIKEPLNGDVSGNKLLMIRNGRTILTYLAGHSDGLPVCKLTGLWRSTTCAVQCADALCARWSCPSECSFSVSGKSRLHVVDASIMKDVTCFNMSSSGVTRTLCHAHNPKHMNVVAVGTNLEKLLLLDMRSGAKMASRGNLRSIRGLSWSPSADQELVTVTDQNLQLWDVRQLSGPSGDFDSCPVSDRIRPQIAFWGRTRVLTMVSRSFISVHDLKSRRMLRLESQLRLRGYHHQEGAFRFAVNEDGDLLYCPSGNRVSVVDLMSGNLICTLGGHQQSVKSIFFNPHLNLMYSFSYNESYVWSSSS